MILLRDSLFLKPEYLLEIDPGHPLARGLLWYAIDQGDVTRLLTNKSAAAPTFLGTQPPYNTGPLGRGYHYATTGTQRWATADAVRPVGERSWACGVYRTGAVAGNSRPFNRTANNGNSAPYMNYNFEVNKSSNPEILNANTFTTGSSFISTPNHTGLTANAPHTLLATAKVGGEFILYFDGLRRTAISAGANLGSYNTGDAMLIGGSSDTSAVASPWIGYVPWAGVWGRELVAYEGRQLHMDPYCFLRRVRHYLYFPVSGETAVARAMQMQTESLYALAQARTGAIEALMATAATHGGNSESLSSASVAHAAMIESLYAAAGAHGANAEALQALAQVRGGGIEALQPATQARGANIESLAGVQRANQTPLEALGFVEVAATHVLSIEAAGAVTGARAGGIEALQALAAGHTHTGEALTGVAPAFTLAIESLGHVARTGAHSLEALASVAFVGTTPAEALLAVSGAGVVSYEVLAHIARAAQIPIEAMLGADVNVIVNVVERVAYFQITLTRGAEFAQAHSRRAEFTKTLTKETDF